MDRNFATDTQGATGVGMFFANNDTVFAALRPWCPLLVAKLGLSPWEFGLVAAVQLTAVPITTAGIAFNITIGSQCLGRFTGDLLIQRHGQARIGGSLIAMGGLTIVRTQYPSMLFVGLASAGFGSATLVPNALGASAQLAEVSQDAGVTLVNWIISIGFLITSPVVGLIATALRWDLALIILIRSRAALLAFRLVETTSH